MQGMKVLAHGVLVKFKASFTKVIEALNDVEIASNVYMEIMKTNPRTAIMIGEKFFFRVDNYSAATVIVLENGDETLVKILATGSRSTPLWLDYGTSRDYVYLILNELTKRLGTKYEIISEANYLRKEDSPKIHFP